MLLKYHNKTYNRTYNRTLNSLQTTPTLLYKPKNEMPMPKQDTKITFHDSCKTYDGLRPNSKVHDALVIAYFQKQCISNPDDIRTFIREKFGADIECSSANTLREVLVSLQELSHRATKLTSKTSAPVLIHGGGSGFRLGLIHKPYMLKFTQLYAKFVESI